MGASKDFSVSTLGPPSPPEGAERSEVYISSLCRSEDDDLKLAMQLSKSLMEEDSGVLQGAQLPTKRDTDVVMDQSHIISEEDEIQKAIAMSLEGEPNLTINM